MEILKKIDWKILNQYIDNKLIKVCKHPEYDIWILNYTPEAAFTKSWDLYTSSCRGLVIDVDGNILARPFKKFHNYEEHDSSEIDMSKKFEIFEKMDGSLIILFYYEKENHWIVASRGSFISDQAIEAKKILNEKYNECFDYIDASLTFLFEVIYPENQIVVNYTGLRDIILLSIIDTKTGGEFSYETINNMFSEDFKIVKKYDIDNVNDLSLLRNLEEDNKEGFVVKFEDGFRIKIKFSEYCRLHRILTNVSNLVVWEHLRDNLDFNELIANVPDEFYNWLKKTIKELQDSYNEIERLALKDFIRIYYTEGKIDKKEFALEAIKTKHSSILFCIYNRKKYDLVIWKQLRPTYSKPFQNGYEEN